MGSLGAVQGGSRRLSRAAGDGRPAPPVRLAHLGLGNFFRAHQAWLTDRADDAGDWGYAAFGGRSAATAEALAGQDGLYTLVTRGNDGDQLDVVSSISGCHAAADHGTWLATVASAAVAVVTMTVTEAGYRAAADPAVQADVAALRADPAAAVSTVPGRLVAGLAARYRADAGPIAVVPCDNVAANGATVARVVRDVAAAVDPGLAGWVERAVSTVTTAVDRITPRTTDDDRRLVTAATGLVDAAPVVAEPFHEWFVAGSFPAGRPAWERVGVTFVDDVTPYERRKLWLLNGAHSLLAYAGSIRGHATVADAMADARCREWVDEWWDDACRHLPAEPGVMPAYREALLGRFANRRIAHGLAQIAQDGSQKLAVRIVPVLVRERDAGRTAAGATRVVAAWLGHLRELGAPVCDARADVVVPLSQGRLADAVPRLLDFLATGLGDDREVVATVMAQAAELGVT